MTDGNVLSAGRSLPRIPKPPVDPLVLGRCTRSMAHTSVVPATPKVVLLGYMRQENICPTSPQEPCEELGECFRPMLTCIASECRRKCSLSTGSTLIHESPHLPKQGGESMSFQNSGLPVRVSSVMRVANASTLVKVEHVEFPVRVVVPQNDTEEKTQSEVLPLCHGGPKGSFGATPNRTAAPSTQQS